MKVDKSFRADHTDQIHPTQQLTLIEFYVRKFYVRYFLSTGFKVSRIDDRVNNTTLVLLFTERTQMNNGRNDDGKIKT